MITNKDIRVENGFLIINGDKYPLDGQSPEAIMEIVEDNSDTTPTENSTAPVTSGGVFAALGTKQDNLVFDDDPTASSDNPVKSDGIKNYVDTIATGKADIFTSNTGGTSQSITIGSGEVANHGYLLSAGYWTQANDNYVCGLVFINSSNNAKFVPLVTSVMTVSVSFSNGVLTLTFGSDPYSNAQVIKLF